MNDCVIIDELPVSTLALGNYSEKFRGHKPDQTKYVFHIKDAVIDPVSGYFYDSELAFIAESSSFSVEHALMRWLNRPTRTPKKTHEGEAIFLGSSAYYHWLIEDFPAYLHALDRYPEAETLISAYAPKYVFDALDLLKVRPKLVSSPIQVRNLYFVSKGAALQAHSEDINRLNNFGNMYRNSKDHLGKYIYISRLNQTRYPNNELEVQKIFVERGFKILDLAEIDLQSQINVFSTASLVAGTHGAGLANLVWTNPNSVLFEILKVEHPNCFKVIADLKNIQYENICSTDEPWIVDLAELDKRLATLMEGARLSNL
jgi:capsular polysaccharide biosynthesis protein